VKCFLFQGADKVGQLEGNTWRIVIARHGDPVRSKTLARTETHCTGMGRSYAHPWGRDRRPYWEVGGRNPVMDGHWKSDSFMSSRFIDNGTKGLFGIGNIMDHLKKRMPNDSPFSTAIKAGFQSLFSCLLGNKAPFVEKPPFLRYPLYKS